MRIATWNVNSIRTRHGRVVDYLVNADVDVLALQEVRAETSDLVPLLGDGWQGDTMLGRLVPAAIWRKQPGSLPDVPHQLEHFPNWSHFRCGMLMQVRLLP